MVENRRIVTALSPPTQNQWTESLSLELNRSQLFCLLSVVGEQASNVGKELLESWSKQSVLSSEVVYKTLNDYGDLATKTGVRISCAVLVFRGSLTVVAGLGASIHLRRGNLAKTIIKASDHKVEIREGSSQSSDIYFLSSEMASPQAEELLSQSAFIDQLLKQWQSSKTEIEKLSKASNGLAVGIVLPNEVLNSKFGQGFLVTEAADSLANKNGLGIHNLIKFNEKNLLEERRASRKSGLGLRQRFRFKLNLFFTKFKKKSAPSLLREAKNAEENQVPRTAAEDIVSEKLIGQSGILVNSKIDVIEIDEDKKKSQLGNGQLEIDKSTNSVLSFQKTKPLHELDKKTPKLRVRKLRESVISYIGRVRPGNSVFVGYHLSRKKMLILITSTIVIIVIVFAIGYLNHTSHIAKQAALGQLAPFQESLDSMKLLQQTDPFSARYQAQSQLAELGSLQATGNFPSVARPELERLLNETRSLYESLAIVSDLTVLPVYDDLRRISPSFLASTSTGDGGRGILADRDQQLLIAYSANDKTGQTVDAASLEKVIAVSQLDGQSYVLGDGVWVLNSPTAEQLNQVIQPSTQTDGATLIATFGSNVYVFNPTQRALYRYAALGSGFSSPVNWLTGAAPFTYSDVSSLVVDGQVWFGTNQGQIYRFVGGKKVDFAISGLDQPLSSTVYLATSRDSQIMAVLEPGGKRLLILNKESGLVSREFVNPNLAAATGLWLDEANNQILISSGAALYNILIEDSF